MDKIRPFGHLPGGAKLAQWRTKHELTQMELASRLGTNPAIISAMERGDRIPHVCTTAAKIEVATAGEVEVGDWIDWKAVEAEITKRLPT